MKQARSHFRLAYRHLKYAINAIKDVIRMTVIGNTHCFHSEQRLATHRDLVMQLNNEGFTIINKEIQNEG